MLAYDYPMMNVFVTMMGVFLFIIWLFLLFRMITDLFRDQEQSGAGKVMWLLILFVFPYLGVLAYIVVHGEGMALRSLEFEQRRSAALRY